MVNDEDLYYTDDNEDEEEFHTPDFQDVSAPSFEKNMSDEEEQSLMDSWTQNDILKYTDFATSSVSKEKAEEKVAEIVEVQEPSLPQQKIVKTASYEEEQQENDLLASTITQDDILAHFDMSLIAKVAPKAESVVIPVPEKHIEVPAIPIQSYKVPVLDEPVKQVVIKTPTITTVKIPKIPSSTITIPSVVIDMQVEQEAEEDFFLSDEEEKKLTEDTIEVEQTPTAVSGDVELYADEGDNVEERTEITKDFEAGDDVRKYTKGKNIFYPHIQLVTSKIQEYHIRLFDDLIPKDTYGREEEGYTIYANMGGDLVLIGKLQPSSIRLLFSASFGSFEKVAYLDEDTKLEGDMVLAICPPTI